MDGYLFVGSPTPLAQGPPGLKVEKECCWPSLPTSLASALVHESVPSLTQQKDCLLRSCELLGQVHPPFFTTGLLLLGTCLEWRETVTPDSALWDGIVLLPPHRPQWTDRWPRRASGAPSAGCELLFLGRSPWFKGKNKTCSRLHLWNYQILNQTKYLQKSLLRTQPVK